MLTAASAVSLSDEEVKQQRAESVGESGERDRGERHRGGGGGYGPDGDREFIAELQKRRESDPTGTAGGGGGVGGSYHRRADSEPQSARTGGSGVGGRVDRRLSREWDAAKVPPSRFQRPEGKFCSCKLLVEFDAAELCLCGRV